MKKILTLTFILVSTLTYMSCTNEEDLIFDKSAAERLNEASDLYSSRLMASPNGWAMQLYPTNENEYPYGNGYLLLCRFNNDHSVNVSMDNVFSENKYMEDTSLWEVITDNGPVLSFNSHNDCIHAFSDPEDLSFTGTDEDSNDETGTGAGGDYEFIIVDAPEDASYMMLKGKKRGTYNLLTPIEQGVEYRDYLADVKAFQNKMFSASVPTFDVMYLGEKTYKITGANDGIPNIFPYDGDEIIDESFNAFLMTKRGNDYYLRFRDAISINDDEKVQEFRYNTERDIFECVENAEYYIDGDDPTRFLCETLDSIKVTSLNDYRWQMAMSNEQSAAWKADFDAINAEFQGQKNPMTLQSMTIMNHNGKVAIKTTYKSKSASSIYTYYDLVSTDGGITLQYTGYYGSANKVLELVPSLNEFLTNTICHKLIAKGATTKFDLNEIRIAFADNPDKWIIANMSRE